MRIKDKVEINSHMTCLSFAYLLSSSRRLVRQKPGGFYIMKKIMTRLSAAHLNPVVAEQLIWILFIAFQRC